MGLEAEDTMNHQQIAHAAARQTVCGPVFYSLGGRPFRYGDKPMRDFDRSQAKALVVAQYGADHPSLRWVDMISAVEV
jgi:hypothetical protein